MAALNICQHILKSGERKGLICGRPSTTVDLISVPYCITHINAYMESIRPLVAAKREAEIQRRMEEKEAFNRALEERRLDYKEMWRLSHLDEMKLNLPEGEGEGEQEGDPIIQKVDQICLETLKAYKIISPMDDLVWFHVYPIQYDGFELNDIRAEFVKRGFKVETNRQNRLFVEMVYIPS